MGRVVESAEFFVVRVPALPFSTLTDWSADVEAPTAVAAELDRALARDRALLESRLQAVCRRPDVSSALHLASPDLMRATVDGAEGGPGAITARARIALVRYVFRMASRSTPFGLFAAFGVGVVGPTTSLAIPPPDSWHRYTTLDGIYLDELLTTLRYSPELLDRVTLRPNETITRVAGRLRLLRRRSVGDERPHHLIEVRPTPELERALDAAGRGACAPSIADAVAAPGPVAHRHLDFVHALVRAQILIADLQLHVTGATPLDALIDDLEDVGVARTTAESLRVVRDTLSRLDAGGSRDRRAHREIRDQLAQIHITAAPAQPCHTDLLLPRGGMTLARTTARDIARAAGLLARIAPPLASDELAHFKSAFVERYGRREVPLVEALDDRIGVGFGAARRERAPLLDGLLGIHGPAITPSFTRREAALLAMVVRAAESGSREVDLTAADIEALAADSPRSMPASFSVVASLASTTAGPRIVFSSCSGPSGLGALGRFCHADRDLADLVRRHLSDEAALDPEAVFAEIAHLSPSASINFQTRPVLREWEIECLGRSGAAPDRRLSIADLLVSVRDDQVELRSMRLGRRVIPRLTSAHNWTSSYGNPPVYRFLCSLQEQDCVGLLYWNWGPLLHAAFLPRVRWGRVVFSRARWTLASSELEPTERDPWRAVQAIRAKRGLPRWILAVEDDNELAVDLDNVLSVDSFAQLLRSRGSAIVKEMYPGPDELVSTGPQGPFTHQLIVPFIVKAPTAPESTDAPAVSTPAPSQSLRVFALCGEWTVLRLDCETALSDRLLLEMISPVVDAWAADGAIDCWYFVRLQGSFPGIAMHVHGDPDVSLPTLRRLAAQALDAGLARDASFNTHVQQAWADEAVAGRTASERLAQADSRAAFDVLSVLGLDSRRQDDRWRICLVGVDRWLCDLGLDLDQRLVHAKAMSRAIAQGEKLAAGASPRLGERFRAERTTLSRLLAASDRSDPLGSCLGILSRRSAETASVLTELADTGHPDSEVPARQELASALVHGWVNRVMRSRDRAHEWAIYELLRRLYEASAHLRAAGERRDT